MFAEVVFPNKFRNPFTYSIPNELEERARTGMRVLVPFGKRYMTGFIIQVKEENNVEEKIKDIVDILDPKPIFTTESLKFYQWIASYYLSSLGEALKNAVPQGLDVETKRKIVADTDFCRELFEEEKPGTVKAAILSVLSEKEEIKLSQLQRLVKRQSIYSQLRSLQEAGAIEIIDELAGAKVRVKMQKFVKLGLPESEVFEKLPELEAKSEKQVPIILELLGRSEKEAALTELKEKLTLSDSPFKTLAKTGLIAIYDKEIVRTHEEEYNEEEKKLTITQQQQLAVNSVKAKTEPFDFEVFLLHGVTGSGKTQVYIELTEDVLSKGKNVLILVPEISLTPQITARFLNRFGDKVALMHSKLSLGERYDTWRKILAGKFNIVIGARSALFAPLDNIGLVIVDEEHDSSYKQNDLPPKYNARDAAIMKANMEKFPILLGSATPSVESMYNAETGKYKLLELTERIDNARLPEIKLVNVSVEQKLKKMENIFSRQLLNAIEDRIKKNEGVILLQNRRGFATQIYCEDCGEIEMCPNCSVSMVFHVHKNILQCHYCGITKKPPKGCSKCGSVELKYFGTGTQRVEDELEYFIPEIKLERVDSDSINRKGELGKILNRFREGETQVLVGTQMVSKGLDFANVTLVGVVSAETSLWMPDFRSDERTFQLLTQVSGRAGRSEKPGLVLIQTRDDSHFVLQKVVQNDYPGFYKREIALRKESSYPPFSRLCVIEAKDSKKENVMGGLQEFYNLLMQWRKYIDVHPPAPAVIEKVKNIYRYNILIKSYKDIDPSGKILREAVQESWIEFNKLNRYRELRVTIDIDPQSML